MKEWSHLKTNKKAVSEMISYVLLISIALALSFLVFKFLLPYVVPSSQPQCPSDIFLTVESADCKVGGQLTIKVNNKGLFNVDGMLIKVGLAGTNKRTDLFTRADLAFFKDQDGKRVILGPGESITQSRGLESKVVSGAGNYIVEIVPRVNVTKETDKKQVFASCTAAAVSQPMVCNN